MFFALVAGLLGSFSRLGNSFYLVAGLAALTAVAAMAIRKCDIDDAVAREAPDGENGKAEAARPFGEMLRASWHDRRVVVLVAVLFLCNLANAAMLELLGEVLPHGGASGASLYLSGAIVLAQIVMVGAALTVPAFADRLGRKPVFAFAMCALVTRGVLLVSPAAASRGQPLIELRSVHVSPCVTHSSVISETAAPASTSTGFDSKITCGSEQ